MMAGGTNVGNAYLNVAPQLAPGAAASLTAEATAMGNSAASGMKGGFSAASVAIGNIISGFVMQLGNAAVQFVGDTLETGQKFDTAMSQVVATMGYSMDELADSSSQAAQDYKTLEGFAIQMGESSVFSATQSAEALNYMALAGYDVQQSMDMLPNVLNLAAAGSFDLARASDMVTDTQTAFGISAERTTQLVDEMAKAASTGNTSVEQLGDAFLTVGGLAAELNGGMVTLADGTQAETDGIQQLEIALTAMANAGVKGSEAGTHMRNMLLKLASPTSDGTKQLEELGVAVFDAQGNMRSLGDVFTDLNGSLSSLTQEQKIQAIGDLFNTRDLASAEALLAAVGEDWDSIGAAILDAEGAAEQMANVQLDNLEGDVTRLNSKMEAFQIQLYHYVEPALRGLAQWATEAVGAMMDGFNVAGEAVTAFYAEHIEPVVASITEAVEASGLLGYLEQAWQMLQGFATSVLEPLGAFLQDVFLTALGAIGDLVSNHVVPAIADFSDFVINEVVPVVSELTSWIGDALGEAFSMFWDWVVNSAIPAIGDFVAGIVDNVVPALRDMWGWFKDNIVPILQDFAAVVRDYVLPFIGDVARFITESAIPAIKDLWSWVGDHLTPVFQGLGNMVQWVVDLIRGIADAVSNAISWMGSLVSYQGTLASSYSYGYYPMYATGGFTSGPSIVGERGTEFVWPSYGPYLDRYADALASRIGTGTGGNVTITGNEFNVRSEADIEAIGRELVNQWHNSQRSGVWRS